MIYLYIQAFELHWYTNSWFLNNDFRNKFDYIFMFHALEHLENTNKYLNKIYNILNKNGKLIIEVPNAFHDLNTHPYYIFFHMHITIFCYENTPRFTTTI